MTKFTAWAIGIVATIGIILAQIVLPFAFDFLSTFGVYGLGVFVGNYTRTK